MINKLTAEDHVQILKLFATYNHAIDSGDTEAWANCFTPNGEYSIPHLSYVRRGREQLVQMARDNSAEALGAVTRHWNNNIVIEGEGDTATAEAYFMVYGLGKDGPQVMGTGIYHDQLSRVNGQWKFVERKSTIDEWAKPLGDSKARLKALGIIE